MSSDTETSQIVFFRGWRTCGAFLGFPVTSKAMRNAPERAMRIENAEGAEFLETVRTLFREYETNIRVSLCFQGFEEELASLPGAYAQPSGRLLVAFDWDEPAGCGAFRQLENGVCEMKRLFVRPEHQGKAIGAALARALIEQAIEAGYSRMRLDTMPSMTRAITMYRALGFKEIPAYRFNPVPGSMFFELRLAEVKFPRKAITTEALK